MSTSMSLYGLVSDLQRIDELSDSEDKELATVEIVKMIQHKTESTVGYLKHIDDMIELCDKRLQELNDVRKKLYNKSDWVQANVVACMDMMRVDKIESGISSVKIRKPTKIVYVTDVKSLPDEYKVTHTSIVPDKKALKEKLSCGEIIDGCELIDGKRSLIY